MNVIDLDAALLRLADGKVRNRIYKVGIELEGMWVKEPPGGLPIRDGSVVFNGMPTRAVVDAQGRRVNAPVTTPTGPALIGELPSEPLGMDEWRKWVKANYPKHVNATCGMHIHMSFVNAFAYQRIMVPDFTPTLVKYVSQWATGAGLPATHPLWPRLRGESEYCQHHFYADAQARKTSKDYERHAKGCRYTVMNYCYIRHQTAECRLLPMFETPTQAIDALQRIMDITNAFLAATASREPRHSINVFMEQECLVEESIECV